MCVVRVCVVSAAWSGSAQWLYERLKQYLEASGTLSSYPLVSIEDLSLRHPPFLCYPMAVPL
jgi:hypothetical protein